MFQLTEAWPDLGAGHTLTVSRETSERFVIYMRLLRQWQRKINLISPATLDDAEERHLKDSLQLTEHLKDARRVVDMGSGAGFPGMVLAIAMAEGGGGEVHLIESSAKKCAFLRTVSRETGINESGVTLIVHNNRIENVVGALTVPELLTARALAPLEKLLAYGENWLGGKARALFQKGKEHESEIERAQKDWRFNLNTHPSAIERGSVILEISDLQRR